MKKTLVEELELGKKSGSLKINIIRYYIINGESTLAELGREMDLSIPTVTKLIGELTEDGFVVDIGKQETAGGRRPNKYGLNPDSGYFVGVDIKDFSINLATINLNGSVIFSDELPYRQYNTPESLNELVTIIENFIASLPVPRTKILSVGVNISGHVNSDTGYSYSRYYFNDQPLNEILHNRLGLFVSIDNDARSMAYGEYMSGVVKDEKNVLFVNVSWGLGLGIITNGKLYYGKSGYAGEFGHMTVFDNEMMCYCGKKGCLETQASGSYIHRRALEKIADGNSSILEEITKDGKDLMLADIIEATAKGDMLAIELVEEIGTTLGRHIGGLINIFNPELVVIGGSVAQTGDYLILPLKSAIRKYALNLLGKDTALKLSILGDKAGVVGACLLARSKMLNLI